MPKATAALLHWSNLCWSVYITADGMKVMSLRQAAIFLGQKQKDVASFVFRNRLETIQVQIPNGIAIEAYTLPTIGKYLNYLLDRNLSEQHRLTLTQEEWLDLLNTLLHPEKEVITQPNIYYFKCECMPVDAFAINIKLDKINLQVLLTSNKEYRIGCSEGLKCIKTSPTWLTDDSEKKAKILSKLNISREVTQCRVKASKNIKPSLTYSDWLAIWEYFANNGNKLAITILKACALESIASRAKRLSLN
ncbi:MAG: hypothetical protein AAF378_23935 [Cyanobacteria bacterium P01_A01_bin.84]